MTSSLSQVNVDDTGNAIESTNTSTGESVPSRSQQDEKKTKQLDDKQQGKVEDASLVQPEETKNMESKKKKKKKKDALMAEQETKDTLLSASDNIDSANEMKNEISTIKEKKANEKDKKEKNVVESDEKKVQNDVSSGPIVSVTKRTRPPYKYNPE